MCLNFIPKSINEGNVLPIYQALRLSLIAMTLLFNMAVLAEENQRHSTTTKATKLTFQSAIRSMLQDSQGRFWIGSHAEGLAMYDGQQFSYFSTDDGLSSNQIRSIQEHPDGSIWFGTSLGVNRFDGQRIYQQLPTDQDFGLAFSPTVPTAGLIEDDLWFNAGTRPGVFRWHDQQLTYVAFPMAENTDSRNVYTMTDHSNGHHSKVWLATFSAVFGYDGHQFSVIDDHTLLPIKPINTLHVRSVLEDSQGRLWIGNNGIGVLLQEGQTLINFSEKMGLIHPESQGAGDASPAGTLEHVFAIAEDGAGHIWFGDRDTGAWRFDGKNMTHFSTQDGLSSNGVLAIYQDPQQGLWLGLTDGGLFLFNGTAFVRQFQAD